MKGLKIAMKLPTKPLKKKKKKKIQKITMVGGGGVVGARTIPLFSLVKR